MTWWFVLGSGLQSLASRLGWQGQTKYVVLFLDVSKSL